MTVGGVVVVQFLGCLGLYGVALANARGARFAMHSSGLKQVHSAE